MQCLLANFIAIQLLKKLTAVVELKFHCYVHKILTLNPILSQLNPAHPFTPYSSDNLFNIILPSTLDLQNYFFERVLYTETSCAFLISPVCVATPIPPSLT
jgi:hypothetical protein